ncbi:hypothetical protein BT69DRAFT_297353 [Atractiella rhizophila]|nr:hypothetical protein BT69DRAFT_297353 [Atractiella rhizophila]
MMVALTKLIVEDVQGNDFLDPLAPSHFSSIMFRHLSEFPPSKTRAIRWHSASHSEPQYSLPVLASDPNGPTKHLELPCSIFWRVSI